MVMKNLYTAVSSKKLAITRPFDLFFQAKSLWAGSKTPTRALSFPDACTW
jgi:hypothetical protein